MGDEPGADDVLPATVPVATFQLDVPQDLTWQRAVELARGVAPGLEVQARGSGWSDTAPLVLLDFDDSGLQLTMRRALDGDALRVEGEAEWVDVSGDETRAEHRCVQVLTALCELGGARVVSARFASGTVVASALRHTAR